MIPMLGCAIVQVPAGGRLGGVSHSSSPSPSLCNCSDAPFAHVGSSEAPLQGDVFPGDAPECHNILDDLRPVRPELIPPTVKDAGFQLYARTCDLKDRCRARHASSCEGWKAWYQTKVKPPKEPPWPKFHPVPAAPAFTPREEEVESIELPQSQYPG